MTTTDEISVSHLECGTISIARSLSAPTPESTPPIQLIRCPSDPITDTEKKIALNSTWGQYTVKQKLKIAAKALTPIVIRPFLDRLSWRNPIEEVINTKRCGICFENFAANKSTIFCQHNGHDYCHSCMTSWCTTQIGEGATYLLCPEYDSCRTTLQEEDIATCVSADMLLRYRRFKIMKDNPNYRECPSCNAPNFDGSSTNPALTCSQCSSTYCFTHSNAHPNMTCAAYTRELSQRIKSSDKLVKHTTRNCPKCQSPTEKNGGCNHMTCQACKQDWCWLCGRAIEGSVTEHYSKTNAFGCPGGQFLTGDPMGDCHRHCPNLLSCGRAVYTCAVAVLTGITAVVTLIGLMVCTACLPISACIWACIALARRPRDDVDFAFVFLVPGCVVGLLIMAMGSLAVQIVWGAVCVLPLTVNCAIGRVRRPEEREIVWQEFLYALVFPSVMILAFIDSIE